MEKTCKGCGSVVPPNALFCGECGVPVLLDRSEKGAPAEDGGRPMREGPVAEPTNMSSKAATSVPAEDPPPLQEPKGSVAVSSRAPAADIRARNKVVSLIATILLMTGVAYSLTTGDSPDQAATAEAEATAAVPYDGNSEKTPDAAGEAVVAEVEPADTSGTEPATTDSVPQPDQQDQLAGDSATVAAPVEKRAISYVGAGNRTASPLPDNTENPTPRPSQLVPGNSTPPSDSISRNPFAKGSDSTTATTTSQQDETPPRHYPGNEAPRYPMQAREMRAEGIVQVRAEIRPDGQVGKLWIKQSSGVQVLDVAALDAVRAWRFYPAQRNGMDVAMWLTVPIEFKLRLNSSYGTKD